MASINVLKNKTLLSFIGCAIVASVLLFSNLNRFGMWEPHEVSVAEEAEHIAEGRLDNRHFQRIEARLALVGWQLFGRNDLGSRLTIAVLALLTAMILFLLLRRLSDQRLALFGTLFFICSPLFLYHGRQLTGGLPPVLGEIAAFGGLSLSLFATRALGRTVSVLVGISGVVLGCVTRGLLVGGVAPILAVASARLVSLPWPTERADAEDGPKSRIALPLVLGGIGILLAGAYASVLLFSASDIPIITGGLDSAALTKWKFDFALEQIVYAWFPWIALLPISVVKFFKSGEGAEPPERLFLRALTITGLLFGYFTQVISLDMSGLRSPVTTLPIALGIALALDDLTRERAPERLMVFVAAALVAVMIRDFAQNNLTILYGYGFDKIPIPKKQFTHVIQAGLFTIPFALLLLVAFLSESRFRRWGYRVLIPLAPVVFGAGIAFVVVPGLSVGLSSKYAVEMYEKFKRGDEPLGVYGPSRFFSDARKLKTTREVVEWLDQNRRVFALFPPNKLFELDHKMREKTGAHIHVLDAESDRFIVATSRPEKGEENKNPIAPYVQSEPFNPGPENSMSVNFDNVVTLQGWDIKSGKDTDRINKGKEMVFTTYWRLDGRIPGDYKIFMHIDGPGGRLHGDHEPFEGRFPTSKWQKGDYVKEVYRMKVPLYQGSGKYTIRIGLFKDSGRLKIIDEPTAKQDSLFVTSLMLE